jgi:hypothetical protein
MHLLTYIILTMLITLYDLGQLIASWYTNQLLFLASLLIFVISLILGTAQLTDEDEFQFKMMFYYLIPVGVMLLGNVLMQNEFNNKVLKEFNISLPSLIPGLSSDYINFAENHYISMLFPLIAYFLAVIVGVILKFKNELKKK